MDASPVIWLFRGAAPTESFSPVLEDAGFEVVHISVLRHEFVNDWEAVPAADAVVLTSPRAAEALSIIPDIDRRLPEHAMNLPWFGIGPSTMKEIEKLGAKPVVVKGGSSKRLAEEILNRGIGRVAFFAGDPHRRELIETLEAGGVDVDLRIVYRSIPALETDLAKLPKPDWAVFFSPRGVDIVAGAEGPDWRFVNIAAIGPTTAAAVRRHGWDLEAVADHPTPAALIRSIFRHEAKVDILRP